MLNNITSDIDKYIKLFESNILLDKEESPFLQVYISEKKEQSTNSIYYFSPKKFANNVDFEDIGEQLCDLLKTYETFTFKECHNICISSDISGLSMNSVLSGFLLTYFNCNMYKTNIKKSNIKFKFLLSQKEKELFLEEKEILKSILITRCLSLMSTNDLNINNYIAFIQSLFHGSNVSVDILDPDDHNLSLLSAVGRCAIQKPKMLILKLGKDPDTAFVGKGIMYDTGGLSLKPSNSMDTMYYDMTGSAVALNTMYSLRHSSNINFYSILVLAENAIGPNAYRPGDIIKSRCGKTVEIGNTDAEGRLALADGAHYASKELNCKNIICMGTLTGAVVSALGTEYAGLICNNNVLQKQIIKSWNKVGEKIHALPADENYEALLKSSRADINNIGNKEAGTITAWLFIKMLCEPNINYAGIDIAGSLGRKFRCPKGFLSNCYCVKAMNQFIVDTCLI